MIPTLFVMWSFAAKPETWVAPILKQAAGFHSPPDSRTAIFTPAPRNPAPWTESARVVGSDSGIVG